MDLTKAFDIVKHEMLLYKMNNYGIKGRANRLFRSHLTNFIPHFMMDVITYPCWD